MKRKYVKPNMDLEMFEANEYIAACYTIDCSVTSYDDGGGYIYWDNGDVKNKFDEKDQYDCWGYGCHKLHDVKEDGIPYLNAWWVPYGSSKATHIYCWIDKHTGEYHYSETWKPSSNHS